METEEEKIRKTLDELFENTKTIGDLEEIKILIDDYLDEGYKIKDYIPKYNALVQAFFPSNSV